MEHTLSFPDTGDVGTDLRMKLHAFVDLISERRAGRVISELTGLSQTDTELRTAMGIKRSWTIMVDTKAS